MPCPIVPAPSTATSRTACVVSSLSFSRALKAVRISLPKTSDSRDLRQGREAGQRVAVEGVGLPRRLVPRAVLVADDLDGDDEAVRAELVAGGEAGVELAAGRGGEL